MHRASSVLSVCVTAFEDLTCNLRGIPHPKILGLVELLASNDKVALEAVVVCIILGAPANAQLIPPVAKAVVGAARLP